MRRVGISVVLLAVVVGVAVFVVDAGDASGGIEARPDVKVTVNGTRVKIPPKRATVERVLARAGVTVREGALRAAVSGTVLDAAFNPAEMFVNGLPATLDTRVRRGALVVTYDGVDASEPTLTREIVVPYPNQDKVGKGGRWLAGVEGLVVEVYGERSGEVVERRTEREPVAAREVPLPATVSAGSMVFLTFDDGPDPNFTPQILDVLRAHGVRATFCLVGRYARARPDLVQRIRSEGHVLCNHTENHARLGSMAAEGIRAEIDAGAASIEVGAGARPSLFRFPYGSRSLAADEVVNQMGLRVLGWTVDPSDYLRPGVEVLVARVNQAIRPGGIIGLHDGGGDRSQTVAALPTIIADLRNAGYTFGTP